MKFWKAVAAATIGVTVGFSAAANEGSVAQATEAVRSWLTTTDAGDAANSWKQASARFQSNIPQHKWEESVLSFRAGLGAVKARTLTSATYSTWLPGVPDGEYVVIKYESSFENKASATETIGTVRETDGSWRVMGYFIR